MGNHRAFFMDAKGVVEGITSHQRDFRWVEMAVEPERYDL